MKNIILLTPAILALTLTACSDKKEVGQTPADNTSPLKQVVLGTAPDKPLEIATIRGSAKPGETVTFKGQVMGSDTVFMDGRAVMVMGDPKKMTPCSDIPGDECPTPWDVCCDDPEVVTASIITVQVTDESGKPLKATLKGLSGLKELSWVTVTGKVTEASNKENMVVNASGLFIHPQQN